jgi:hypothetical protein
LKNGANFNEVYKNNQPFAPLTGSIVEVVYEKRWEILLLFMYEQRSSQIAGSFRSKNLPEVLWEA